MRSSILRKKRAQPPSPGEREPPTLRTALSLPDLNMPVLDPSEWDALPSTLTGSNDPHTPVSPGKATSSTTPGGSATAPRGRSPSLVGQGSPVNFHRPFTPWQVVVPVNPSSAANGQNCIGGAGDSASDVDFRTSRVTWNRDSIISHGGSVAGPGMTRGWRKRSKHKALSRLNVVVAGPRSVGKTR